MVGVQLRNIQTKYEASPCGMREVKEVKKFMTMTQDDL